MMKIILVDDEKIIREGAASVIRKVVPEAHLVTCANAEEALRAVEQENYNIAFLDVEMTGMNGIELAHRIKKDHPGTNIIFCTAHPHYTGDAMRLHASGYIVKPLTADKLRAELAELRHPIVAPAPGLRIQCFGNFEMFFNEEPIRFKFSKTKELVAYLVDRKGALVNSAEIQAILWEDEDHPSYYKQLRKDLADTFGQLGLEDAVMVVRGGMSVVPSKMQCDFYDYLDGTPQGINAYHGEYMQQYSWAEMTHGFLESKTYDY